MTRAGRAWPNTADRRGARRLARLAAGGPILASLGYVFRYIDDPTAGLSGTETNEVTVANSSFLPAVVEVPVGTEVTWMFDDTGKHNVVFEGFSSSAMTLGEYQHTFDAAGQNTYVGTFHPLSMKAESSSKADGPSHIGVGGQIDGAPDTAG